MTGFVAFLAWLASWFLGLLAVIAASQRAPAPPARAQPRRAARFVMIAMIVTWLQCALDHRVPLLGDALVLTALACLATSIRRSSPFPRARVLRARFGAGQRMA